MLLYKYTTFEIAKKIISNHEVRFTQPGALNDVFEMNPIFKNHIKDEYLIKAIKEAKDAGMIEEIWDKSLSESYKKLSGEVKSYFTKIEFEEFTKRYIEHILRKENKNLFEFIIDRFSSNRDDFNKELKNQWINVLNKLIGVLCLSEIYNNDLMWASYSQNHSGIVLEFETEHHFFNPIFKVEYKTEIPTLDLNELEDIGKNVFKYLKILKVKLPIWSYEKEYRVCKPLNQRDYVDDNLDSFNYSINLFKFPPQSLTGILFGARCSLDAIEEFKKVIDFELYRNLKLYKMIIDYNTRTISRSDKL